MDSNFVLNFSELFERIQLYAQRVDLPRPILSLSLSNGQVLEGTLSQFFTNSRGQFIIIRTKNNGISWISYASIIAVSLDNPDLYNHLFSENLMISQPDIVSSLTLQRRLSGLSETLSQIFNHKIFIQSDTKNIPNDGLEVLYNYSIVLEEVLKEMSNDSLAKSSFVEEIDILSLQIGSTTQYKLNARTLSIELALPISPKDVDSLEIKERIEGVL
jgi:hypothetical protein